MAAFAALERIASHHDLTPEFPPDVEEEVAELLRNPGVSDGSLQNLTDAPFVTIDHAESRDLDQAVAVATSPNGFEISYAIADAAWYVRPGTALFSEALRRGASFYLPGWMIPMLPRALSEGIVSLNPHVERRAMVFRTTLDAEGRRLETTFVPARIRSRAKLAFGEVQSLLDGETSRLVDAETDRSLRALEVVGQKRATLAAERDVVRYRRQEVQVGFATRERLRFVAEREIRVPVERYNEQLSLLCNTEGARFLRDEQGEGGVDPIFRVHPPPTAARVTELEARLRALAEARGLPERWQWRPENSIASYLEQLPETRVATAIHRQAILVNGRSDFRTEAGAHHGVGADVYARFSAPMREIVGVFLHRELWQRLGRSFGTHPDERALREQVCHAANRARDVQKRLTKEANQLVLDQLLGDDLAAPGRTRTATVMGLRRDKVYLLLDDPPIDVKLYTRHLEEDLGGPVTTDEHGVRLWSSSGELIATLGDAVELAVRGQEPDSGRWRLALVRR